MKIIRILFLCTILLTWSCQSHKQPEIFGGLKLGIPSDEFMELVKSNKQLSNCTGGRVYCYHMGNNIKGEFIASSEANHVVFAELSFNALQGWELEYIKRIFFEKYPINKFNSRWVEADGFRGTVYRNENFNNMSIIIDEQINSFKVTWTLITEGDIREKEEKNKFERDKKNF